MWLQATSKAERKTLVAAFAGYLLVVIAALALPETQGLELTAGDETLAAKA